MTVTALVNLENVKTRCTVRCQGSRGNQAPELQVVCTVTARALLNIPVRLGFWRVFASLELIIQSAETRELRSSSCFSFTSIPESVLCYFN